VEYFRRRSREHEAIEMDQIDTESNVHSSSIHEDIKTRTLYEMIRIWIGQSWDGVRYKRIGEELWNSIDASDLIEGPYGTSVTLLESCIVDSAEGIDAGLFQAEQAVDNLKKLLENDDFGEGARVIEVYVNTSPACRISNIDHLLQRQSREQLRWTRGTTIAFIVSIVTVLGFNVVMVSLQSFYIRLLPWTGIISIYGIWLYYIIKLNSSRVNRAFWILGHACVVGMGVIILYMILLGPIVYFALPPSYRHLALLVFVIVVGSCMVTAGILADRLGKKRGYGPYYL
jgi:hypothetical protein